MQKPLGLEDLQALDAADPLKDVRDTFQIPGNGVYFNGNSLGPRPKSCVTALNRLLHDEWGAKGGAAWKRDDWMALPFTVGSKIACIIGAAEDEVVVADSTTINLAKMLEAGLSLTQGRYIIVTDVQNFPTDRYILEDFVKRHPRLELRVADEDSMLDAIDENVALIALTHVNYRTSRQHDMAAINRRAREVGALTLWDLSHSAGAIPLDISALGTDLAIGCTYKYLNGGPGAPAYIYVAKRHQRLIEAGLPGWMGHENPFDFSPHFSPAPGMQRHLTGTPPIMALTVLNESLDILLAASVDKVLAKNRSLVDCFIRLVNEQLSAMDIVILGDRDRAKCGAQVSLQTPHAASLVDALEEVGIIADYRPPNIIRFGMTGLYVRYSDLWCAVTAIKRTLS